jgi:3-hydroxybutyryl-CoA dehydrogenase
MSATQAVPSSVTDRSATTTTVGVLGAGTMGTGIAVVMARAGHTVRLCDLSGERARAGAEQVARFLRRSVRIGKLSSEACEEMITRVVPAAELGVLADCDVITEAVFESTELKAELFGRLDDVCSESTLFHTNTSTLSVSAIAAGSRKPERVIGTHYCNPAPLMKLVEVVKGLQTSDDTYVRTIRFVEGLGKTTVTTNDTPGFLVNLFLVPFENDCIRALEAGLGSIESIDKAAKLALRYPLGTFELLDIVGLDIHRAVSVSLFEQLHDPRFAPPPLVDRMIAAGHLGRKSGRGFYSYESTVAFGSEGGP